MRPPPDAGFTLAETLAALIVVGLTLGGLAAAMSVATQLEHNASRDIGRSAGLARAQSDLDGLLALSGPVDSQTAAFQGRVDQISFSCGAGHGCGAALSRRQDGIWLQTSGPGASRTVHLPDVVSARFRYIGDGVTTDAWPTPIAQVKRLRRVAIIGRTRADELPLASAAIWTEQSRTCAFDTVSMRCRGPGQ